MTSSCGKIYAFHGFYRAVSHDSNEACQNVAAHNFVLQFRRPNCNAQVGCCERTKSKHSAAECFDGDS